MLSRILRRKVMVGKIAKLCKKVIAKIINILKSDKKNIFIFGILLGFIAINVLVGWFVNILVMLILDVIFLVFGVLPFVINAKTVLWLGKEKPTSYFQDLRFRNMDGIVVGSTKAWKYLNLKGMEDKIYNCLTYERTMTMDFATLKTYFGHVKKEGHVYFVVDYSENEKLGNIIMPRDFSYVHPHIFLESGRKGDKIQAVMPLVYYPRFTVGYFFSKLKKNMGMYNNSTWKLSKGKNLDIDTVKVKKVADRVNTIVNFCWKRDLQPEIILLNADDDNNCANDIIRAYFAPRYPELDLHIISNAKELNEIVGGKNAI